MALMHALTLPVKYLGLIFPHFKEDLIGVMPDIKRTYSVKESFEKNS